MPRLTDDRRPRRQAANFRCRHRFAEEAEVPGEPATGLQSAPRGTGWPCSAVTRGPVAAALLGGGLLAVGGGVGGSLLVTGHNGISQRPAAPPDRPPAGVVAAPPRPATAARVSRPVYLSIPVIGVRTRLSR